MKKAMLKVLSLAMALTLVASLAACGGNSEEETTTGADTSTEAVVTPDETVAGEEVPSEDASAAEETTVIVTDAEGHTQVVTQAPAKPGDKTTQAPAKPGDNNKPTQAPGKPADATQEALDLFNKATVGKGKAGKRTTDVKLNKLPGSLDSVKGMLQNMIAGSTKPADISKFANSTLTKADVSSATAVKNGNNTVVTIKVKDGTATNAKAFEELPKKDIDSWLVDKLNVTPYENVKFIYANGTIVATIDANGNVVNATYTMHVTLDIRNVQAKIGPIKPNIDVANVSVTQIDKF